MILPYKYKGFNLQLKYKDCKEVYRSKPLFLKENHIPIL